MPKITVVLVNRSNYARLKPVMELMRDNEQIDMQVVCAGSMLLERFGMVRDIVSQDGFEITDEVYMEIEGSVPQTIAESIGLGILKFAPVFQRHNPDFVLLIGDRFEALAAAIAATYQNICLIHLQGGEISGSIDELTRHAITKLAHYHFPANIKAGENIVDMGEDVEKVFPLGCPSVDVIEKEKDKAVSGYELNSKGIGDFFDHREPYLLSVFHPVSTELFYDQIGIFEAFSAFNQLNMQTIMLWPNIDAGSDSFSHIIRAFIGSDHNFPLRLYKEFGNQYISLMNNAACLVGNSSSFVRDSSFLGTPVVLVGSRQDGRERAENVIRVEPDKDEIVAAIKKQIEHGRYEPSDLYGKPGTSKRIVDTILTLEPYIQKRLSYV